MPAPGVGGQVAPHDKTDPLTVDDDPDVLNAIARDLRTKYGRDYRVLRAESGTAALELLRELKERGTPVALLLSDQRMPGMDGVTFLSQAVEDFPKAKRVLITAYADTEAAIKRDQPIAGSLLFGEAVGSAGREALPGPRRHVGGVAGILPAWL